MRLVKVPRRRSRAWWGVYLFALLTVSAYVLFDILDVDGSQVTGWPGDDIIVVETPQVEADRFLRADSLTPASAGLISTWLSQSSAIESRGTSQATGILRARQSWMLPRVNLQREMARISPSATDPA